MTGEDSIPPSAFRLSLEARIVLWSFNAAIVALIVADLAGVNLVSLGVGFMDAIGCHDGNVAEGISAGAWAFGYVVLTLGGALAVGLRATNQTVRSAIADLNLVPESRGLALRFVWSPELRWTLGVMSMLTLVLVFVLDYPGGEGAFGFLLFLISILPLITTFRLLLIQISLGTCLGKSAHLLITAGIVATFGVILLFSAATLLWVTCVPVLNQLLPHFAPAEADA